jgi:hypothetical protein
MTTRQCARRVSEWCQHRARPTPVRHPFPETN